MTGCNQELCAYWTGDGCICRVLDIDPESTAPRTVLDSFLLAPSASLVDQILDKVSDVLASTPPFSWLNRALGGSVTPPK